MEVTAIFESRGWKVLRIWECELKKKNEVVLLKKLQEYQLITLHEEANAENLKRV